MQRIAWIDSFRGLMIFLVVLEHFDANIALFNGIRMPAFFFISGYLFSRRYTSFTPFIKHRFRQLIVPYFAFFFIVLLMTWVMFTLVNREIDVIAAVKAIFYGNITDQLIFSTSLWFIATLFTTELYFFVLFNSTKNSKQLFIGLLFMLPIGYLTTFLPVRPPWSLDTSFTMVFFYGLGFLLKSEQKLSLFSINNSALRTVVVVGMLIVSYYLSNPEHRSWFAINYYANYALMLLSALIGIVAILLMMEYAFIEKSRFLRWCGQNSYTLLAFEEFSAAITAKVSTAIGGKLPFLEEGYLYMALHITLGMIVLAVIATLLNRYFSFILNKKQ